MKRDHNRAPSGARLSPCVRSLLGALLLGTLPGCGGSAASAEPAEAPEPAEQEPSTPDPDATVDEGEPEGSASAEGENEATAKTAEGRREQGDTSQLNVVFRQTPEGPVITVAGVEFRAKTKTIRQSDGSYAAQFNVVARSVDGNMHRVLTPASGPLSIAGTIESKGGKKDRFSATRDGEDEQFIPPDDELTLSQTWPAKDQPKFWWGQKARLEVGLWGLAADAERRRPVRKLLVVSTVARDGASAVVTPPEF